MEEHQPKEEFMNPKGKSYRHIIATYIGVAGIALMGLGVRIVHADSDSDSLYIGNDTQDSNNRFTVNNTVERFDANTGKYLGSFVKFDSSCPAPSSSLNPPQTKSCLYGPMGLIFDGRGHLLVANQNINLNPNGTIIEYRADSGAFVETLVPYTANPPPNLNSPPAPRGIVLKGNTLFVASEFGKDFDLAQAGVLQTYKENTGGIIRTLDPPPPTLIPSSMFHPRGVVIGPDGLLYVSNDPALGQTDGDILRYWASGTFKDIFVSNANTAAKQGPCSCDFNRPEGLVFGPDGKLYVTSFRANTSDTDKILIFSGPDSDKPGKFIGKIELDQVGTDRAFAQALLFGPGGKLFVPISAPVSSSQYAGQVRRYDVSDLKNITFDIFVPSKLGPPPPLASWYYLTFGRTDPATLNYMRPD
jgi:hypothetical protein